MIEWSGHTSAQGLSTICGRVSLYHETYRQHFRQEETAAARLDVVRGLLAEAQALCAELHDLEPHP